MRGFLLGALRVCSEVEGIADTLWCSSAQEKQGVDLSKWVRSQMLNSKHNTAHSPHLQDVDTLSASRKSQNLCAL